MHQWFGHFPVYMNLHHCPLSGYPGNLQKKCILLNAGENMNEFRNTISEECSPGDVMYYRGTFGADIRVILAATACDFSKSIILGDEELACIYNGITNSK